LKLIALAQQGRAGMELQVLRALKVLKVLQAHKAQQDQRELVVVELGLPDLQVLKVPQAQAALLEKLGPHLGMSIDFQIIQLNLILALDILK
jgi:hypothetical protein